MWYSTGAKEMKLDLRVVNGLNLTFESLKPNISISLIYDGNLDYSGTYLSFNPNKDNGTFIPTFIPVDDKTDVNNLKLGLLNTSGNNVTFLKKGEIKTAVQAESISMTSSTLVNISAMMIPENNLIDLVLGDNDSFDIRISKTEPNIHFQWE